MNLISFSPNHDAICVENRRFPATRNASLRIVDFSRQFCCIFIEIGIIVFSGLVAVITAVTTIIPLCAFSTRIGFSCFISFRLSGLIRFFLRLTNSIIAIIVATAFTGTSIVVTIFIAVVIARIATFLRVDRLRFRRNFRRNPEEAFNPRPQT